MEISGQTRIMFMLCDPVHHVRGSVLLNEWLAADGINAVINPIHVGEDGLGAVTDAIRNMRNVAGTGVTIPHKISILNHVDEVSELARLIGSANFVRREDSGALIATNIDGEGFAQGCRSRGIELAGRNVLQLGVGGAGRATAVAVARSGASSLHLWNRTADRAEEFAAELREHFPDLDCRAIAWIDASGYDVLVNTTPAGMAGFEPLDVDLSAASDELAVVDIIVNPAVTPLLADAQARGLKTSTGADMLRGQYELMREFMGLVPA